MHLVPNESCGGDVKDEMLPALVDEPWNDKRYEIVFCCQSWLLTADPPVVFAKLAQR